MSRPIFACRSQEAITIAGKHFKPGELIDGAVISKMPENERLRQMAAGKLQPGDVEGSNYFKNAFKEAIRRDPSFMKDVRLHSSVISISS